MGWLRFCSSLSVLLFNAFLSSSSFPSRVLIPSKDFAPKTYLSIWLWIPKLWQWILQNVSFFNPSLSVGFGQMEPQAGCQRAQGGKRRQRIYCPIPYCFVMVLYCSVMLLYDFSSNFVALLPWFHFLFLLTPCSYLSSSAFRVVH